MIRQWVSISAAAVLLMSYSAPIGAAGLNSFTPEAVQTDGQQEQSSEKLEQSMQDKLHKGKMSREDFEAYRFAKLKEMAAYFGINVDGKSAEQLKQELEVAKSANKEKWEAFKAEQKAMRLERLRKDAAEHGIDTNGKSARELHEELNKVHGSDKRHRPQQESSSKRKVDKQ